MTDAEIIKALECCINNNGICEDCPLLNKRNNSIECTNELIRDALDLINRQKAEIDQFADIGKMYSEVRAEAIREFAERLKAINKVCCTNPNDLKEMNFIVDNLVKEMVGEE